MSEMMDMHNIFNKALVLILISFCWLQLGCDVTETASERRCSFIITKSIIHFEEVISHEDEFKEEWIFYCDIAKPSYNPNSLSLGANTDAQIFYIDSICTVDRNPALGEPYFLPFSEQTVSEYIELNADSLFHPLLGKWISSSEDVFREIDYEKVEFITLDGRFSKKGENKNINPIALNASFSKIYENSNEVCVEMALSFPVESKVKEIGNYLTLIIFLDRENLELNNYGVGIRSGLVSICDKMEVKVEISKN